MVDLVLKFVGIARSAGLRIATSEVLDCLNQMQLVDIAQEPVVAMRFFAPQAACLQQQRRATLGGGRICRTWAPVWVYPGRR